MASFWAYGGARGSMHVACHAPLTPSSHPSQPLALTLNPYHPAPVTRWLAMRVVAATPPRERNKVKLLALLVSSAESGSAAIQDHKPRER